MPYSSGQLDRVFQALAHPTRRAVIERLARRPSAVSDLAAPFDMALPSFLQHVQVLDASGLVRSTKSGRVRTLELTPEPLQQADRWLVTQEKLWTTRLQQLDSYLISLKGTPS